MQSAKIHLSAQQIKLVTNANFILTKNEIRQQNNLLISSTSIEKINSATEILLQQFGFLINVAV